MYYIINKFIVKWIQYNIFIANKKCNLTFSWLKDKKYF